MIHVLFHTLQIHQYIINEDHYELIHIWSKHSVHQIHESSWCISQLERYHQKLIMTISSTKCRIRNIGFLIRN